jgi:ornithine cyclodeaminase/alanine dehydrogenase
MTGSPVFVSTEAAALVFEWADAVAVLQAAYAESREPASLPPRTIGRSRGSWLRTLPGLPGGSRYFGAKLMGMTTVAPSPVVEYVIVLFDRETSRIAAFVDGNEVTAYRTAATSAAALDSRLPGARLRPHPPARATRDNHRGSPLLPRHLTDPPSGAASPPSS